jgi:hypothetical protein
MSLATELTAFCMNTGNKRGALLRVKHIHNTAGAMVLIAIDPYNEVIENLTFLSERNLQAQCMKPLPLRSKVVTLCPKCLTCNILLYTFVAMAYNYSNCGPCPSPCLLDVSETGFCLPSSGGAYSDGPNSSSNKTNRKMFVFWDIRSQFVPQRKHITSPLQSRAD